MLVDIVKGTCYSTSNSMTTWLLQFTPSDQITGLTSLGQKNMWSGISYREQRLIWALIQEDKHNHFTVNDASAAYDKWFEDQPLSHAMIKNTLLDMHKHITVKLLDNQVGNTWHVWPITVKLFVHVTRVHALGDAPTAVRSLTQTFAGVR